MTAGLAVLLAGFAVTLAGAARFAHLRRTGGPRRSAIFLMYGGMPLTVAAAVVLNLRSGAAGRWSAVVLLGVIAAAMAWLLSQALAAEARRQQVRAARPAGDETA